MFNKDKVIAFDLDGTLLDSANDLVLSLNILLKEQKQKSISRNKVNSLVGNGALAMIKKAYEINANNENVNWDELKDRFLEIYKSCYTKNTKLYPYTIETLNFLKKSKFKIILVSNKPEYFVNKILDYFNITSFFKAISGGDTFQYRKPDPRHLTETIKKANIVNYDCIFVGDSINDALCAKNSKSKLVLLEHGYSNEDINNMEADFVCADLKNFCKVISSL
tara:strand:+ start:3668 stop:4333 length:666 start_codon:yes stop_codon:yes gene_type:complete